MLRAKGKVAIAVATFLRSDSVDIPASFGEYETAIALVCSQVVSTSNGMSASFLYESAKDVLKWSNLSRKKYISLVMRIGNLIHLEEQGFEELKNETEYLEVDEEDLAKIIKG